MVFSFWNVITLIIVFVVLAIYRQLDVRNRSLEKVKKYSDKVLKSMNGLVDERARQMKDMAIELEVNLKTGKEALKRVREVEQRLGEKATHIDSIEERIGAYDQVLQELANMTSRVDENLRRIHEESEFVDRVGKSVGEAANQLQRLEKRIPQIEKDLSARNAKKVEGMRKEFARRLQAHTRKVVGEVKEAQGRIDDFSSYMTRLEGRKDALEAETMARMEKTTEELELRLHASGENLTRRIDELINDSETGALERVEKRLGEYDQDLQYRFEKLEQVNVDIEAMDANLRSLMSRVEAGVGEDFDGFVRDFSQKRDGERKKADEEIQEFWARYKEVEDGLADLKSQAYQDVSEKLKVFEDEFFADLKNRSNAMDARMGGWQTDVEERLQTIARENTAARTKIEADYQEDLTKGLEESRRSTLEELRKIEARIADFENQVRWKIDKTEDTVRSFSANLKAEIDQARAESLELFEQEARELKSTIDANLEKMGRDVEIDLTRQQGELELGKKELFDLFEATKADVTVGQARILQQLKENEAEIGDKLSQFRSDIESTVSGLRDEFAAQRDDLIVVSNEERINLRNDLGEIAERTAELENDLAKRTESAMAGLSKELESFELEFRKKTNEFNAESDKRIRGVKTQLDGVRDKAEAMQQKQFGKIEESYNLLSVSLDDIDKRLKSFASQTKVFERADNLKLMLEGDIDGLKSGIVTVQGQRKEIHDIETQLLQTRRLAEEVSGKLSKFMAERRRIGEMDEDFKKLIGLSREIDLKLESATSSHDTLHEILARIRSLEELQEVVDARYERLEKKKDIIETTSDGVNKNFQTLETLESSMDQIRPQIEGFSIQLSAMRETYEYLEEHRDAAEVVVKKIDGVDGTLAEIEGRMEKLTKARDWLARTETRLEEIGQQAQDQVKLLENLVKKELPAGGKDGGAATHEKRATVVKLARQGWSAPEIARVTKLSRGEVELILEIQPKGR